MTISDILGPERRPVGTRALPDNEVLKAFELISDGVMVSKRGVKGR